MYEPYLSGYKLVKAQMSRKTPPLFFHLLTQPRPQGLSLKKWMGREKALASAGYVSPRTPQNPGCNNLALCENLKLCVTSPRAILGGLLYLLKINERFYKISFSSQILATVFFLLSFVFYEGGSE